MGKKLTQDEVIKQFKDRHGDKYIYDKVEYINEKTKVWIGCKVEGHGYFEQTPDCHKSGNGCPKCGGKLRLNDAEVKDILFSNGYIWESGEYINSETRNLVCIDLEGYKYLISLNKLMQNKNPSRFGKGNIFTIESISLFLYNSKANIQYNDSSFISSTYLHNWKCLKCNSDFQSIWNNIKSGNRCPYCCNHPQKVNIMNSIRTARPDLVKYFVNKHECDIYTPYSNKKVKMICPQCNMIKSKMQTIATLSNRGFSCNYCSDGISMPEKVMLNILKQLKIKFIKEYSPKWAENKRYDFYIPSINTIVEVNGEQHYENKGWGDTLESIQNNDLFKKENAIKNEVTNYVILDAKSSDFEYLKNSYIESLKNIIDISKVDWGMVFVDAQSSIKFKVWCAWNDKAEHETTKEISEMFEISTTTLIKYLKIGTTLNMCIYNPIIEQNKSGSKNGKISSKTVYQYSIDKIFIREYTSVTEAEKINLIRGISKCCTGKQSTCGGFIWSYIKFKGRW